MKKKYYRYPTRKAFLKANISADTLVRLHDNDLVPRDLVYGHRNCPMLVLSDGLSSSNEYLKVTAMLARCRWPEYIDRALGAHNSLYVRLVACKRALFNGYNLEKVRDLIRDDKHLSIHFMGE